MIKLGTGWSRGSAAALLALLLTALTFTGLYGTASAAPERAAAGGQGRTMLLLDSSGSMAEKAGGGKTKIEAAKSALRTVVKGLPDDAEVGLRVFGAKVFSRKDAGSCKDSQVVVKPGADNRDALLGEIDKYKPYGETPIPHALREAAKDLGKEGARSIILVSDGESTCDPDPCKVAEDLAEDGIDLRIDVVGLSVSGKAREQLKCIAKSGNGDYFDADDAGDIEATLTRVARRAVQPFTVAGEPISGGTESNPTPITVGTWADTIGDEEKFYVFERKEAGSTLRVSATAQGTQGLDGLTLYIRTAEGAFCDYGQSVRTYRHLLAGTQATAGDDNGCGKPGKYVVKLSRSFVEDDTTVGLRVTEEPPVVDPGFTSPTGEGIKSLEVRELPFEGIAKPVAGSPSFEAAPELTTGVWSSDIVAGETLIYRFRLEYGQSANVGLRFLAGTPAHYDAFGVDVFAPKAWLTLHNPLRANLGTPDAGVVTGDAGASKETNLRTVTPQVSKVTGQGGGKYDGGGDVTTAGDYYMSIGASHHDDKIELPFEIDLQIEGEPQPGPTYADGVSWSITDGLGAAAPPASEAEAAESGSETSATVEGGSTALWIGLGLGAGVLVLAGLAVALMFRRRSAPRTL